MNNNTYISCPSYPPLPVCSNNGVCDTLSGICVCRDGWSSIGDFSTSSRGICQINIMAIRIIWIIMLIPSPILIYLPMVNIKNMMKSSKRRKINDYPFIFHALVIISNIAFIPMSIMKIVDPVQYAIGLNIPVTIAFYICYTGIAAGGCVFLIVITKFLINQTKSMPEKAMKYIERQSEVIVRLAYFFAMLAPIGSAYPFWSVVNPSLVYNGLIGLLSSYIIGNTFLALWIFRSLSIIITALETHLKESKIDDSSAVERDNAINTVKDNLRKTRFYIVLFSPQALLPYILMVSWYMLSINTSYIWPFVITSLNLSGLSFVQIFAKRVEKANSHPISKELTSNARVATVGNNET